MKKYYGLLARILMTTGFVMALSLGKVQAQEATVSGKIIDSSTGEAIPGANVMIKGKSAGAISGIDGSYSVSADADDVLVISFIGYATQEIKVANQSIIDVGLALDIAQLEEIVVIGYGEVNKDDATGSVVAIGEDDFNKGAVASPQDLLVGKVPGLVINSNNGEPGANSTIRIRGGSSLRASNDPLIVIDGMPLETSGIAGLGNPLSTINPADIASFTILKDASATAIYGSRASNGVIIITTKSGSAGKPKISYTGNASIGVRTNSLDVYSGDQYRALIQEKVNDGTLSDVALDGLGDANTDWQDLIYQDAFSMDHSVSVNGTAANIPYRASVGFTDQDGLLKNSNFERTSLNLTANPSLLNDDLRLSLNAKLSSTNTNFSNTDAIGDAVRFDPTLPVRNGNTRYGGYTAWTNLTDDPSTSLAPNGDPNNIATHNPVARLRYRDNTSTGLRYILGGKADYKLPFLRDLTATLNLGYDYVNYEGRDVIDPLASWAAREPESNIKNYEQTKENSLLDFYLNYKKDFDFLNSSIDLTSGYSYQKFKNSGIDGARPWNTELVNDPEELPYENEYVILSFFGRLNYTVFDRYIVTATLRNDHSSLISPDERSGIFPAVALAWQLNEESFLQNADFLDNLKIRAGWGQTGQQSVGTDPKESADFYPYIPVYTVSEQGALYQLGNTFYATQRPEAYDVGLKWETTTTINAGLDFSLAQGRVSGSFDVYKRETEDLLNEIPIAAGSNFSNFLLTNVGTMENRGYEAALTVVPVSTEKFSWEVSGNVTYNENKITQLTQVDAPDFLGNTTGGISGGVGNTVQKDVVGSPTRTFHLFNQVYDTDGRPIEGLYLDNTGNGGDVSGDELNKQYLKTPQPDYLIGVSSKVTYGNIDFSFSGRFSLGNYVYNNTASSLALYNNLYDQSGFRANIPTSVERSGFNNAQYHSDFYLEDASFFRMDNMSLGYSFDKLFFDRLNGRVSFTVQNAFVVSDYSGLDPEVIKTTPDAFDPGIDDNIYPRPRTYMLGLNLNF